jgi:hypothetical protein
LFSGLQIPNGAKAPKKAIGTEYLKSETKNIKDVINTFDQITRSGKKLINDAKQKQNFKAIEEGLAIPYDRDKIKLASLELDSKRIELQGKRKLVFRKIRYLTGYTDSEICSL